MAASIYITLDGSDFIKFAQIEGETVADLKVRACVEFSTSSARTKLHALTHARALAISSGAPVEDNDVAHPLSSLLHLGVNLTYFFLATTSARGGAEGGAADDGRSVVTLLEALATDVSSLKADVSSLKALQTAMVADISSLKAFQVSVADKAENDRIQRLIVQPMPASKL